MVFNPLPDRPALQRTLQRSAVFLAKDGTLVENVPWNVDTDQLRFLPRALDGLRALGSLRHAVVLVTNQPGLALGLFTRAALKRVEDTLAERIHGETGLELAGIYTCPHRPGPGGRPACLCRLPAAGLLRQAALSLRIDLAHSWMVGDTLDEVEAGRRAGCRTVLVETGTETAWRMSPLRTPHHRAHDLMEAAGLIAAAGAAEQIQLAAEASAEHEPGFEPELPVPHDAARRAAIRVRPSGAFAPREWL